MKVFTVVFTCLLADGMAGVDGHGEHMEILLAIMEMLYHVKYHITIMF